MFVLGSFCNQSGALFFNAWKFSTPSRVRNTMARKKEMATSTAHLYIHFASAKSLWILFVIFKPSLHCRTRISKVHNAACIFMVHGNRRVYVQAWTYGHPMSRFSFHGGESKRQQLARTFEELKWTSENTLNGSVFVYVCSCVQFGEILLSILHRINRKQKRKALVFSTLQKKVLKLPAHTTEKKQFGIGGEIRNGSTKFLLKRRNEWKWGHQAAGTTDCVSRGPRDRILEQRVDFFGARQNTEADHPAVEVDRAARLQGHDAKMNRKQDITDRTGMDRTWYSDLREGERDR